MGLVEQRKDEVWELESIILFTSECETIYKYYNLIRKCHFPQKYSNSIPYHYHLLKTKEVGQHFSQFYPEMDDREFYIACLGHDVLEDTACKEQDLIEWGFPAFSIELIKAVTDEPGKNRKERKLKTYPKIRGNKLATALKLCDRIANVRANLEEGNDGLINMYRNEHQEFINNLQVEGELDVMWMYLGNLLYQGQVLNFPKKTPRGRVMYDMGRGTMEQDFDCPCCEE